MQPTRALLAPLAFAIGLTGCDAVDQLQEDCAAGDENACEILETIGAAIDELEEAVPTDMTLASIFEDEDDFTVSDKDERLAEVLDATVIERDGLAACLRALPPPPPVRDPICYGPQMNYTGHPDGTPADGQLPTGDLGIWLHTEPTQADEGNAPCAAVKMNELITKALHNIDMATGSVAMMMCAAAHERISAPKNNGDTLNFASVLNKVPNSPFTITTATLTRVDAETLKTVLVAEHNGGNNFRLGELSITTTHNRATKNGLVQIERAGQNNGQKIVTSARYRPKPNDTTTLQVQVAQGRFDTNQITDFYDAEGDTKLGPIEGSGGSPGARPIEDTHYFVAEFNKADQEQHIAYGWNAGGNDSHYRVFNATASGSTADAWYGYTENPYSPDNNNTTVGATPDLDLSATNAGMICNWAGPGNSHATNTYLQHQTMTKDSENRWILTTNGSLIRYAPTNSCEVTSAGPTFTIVVDAGKDATAQQAHDIGSSDTLVNSAADFMDAKSSHNMTLPDDSW